MTKKMKFWGLMLGAALMAATTVSAEEPSEEMTGAYEMNMEEGVTDEAQKAFDKAMESYLGEKNLTPVQLLASQLVAGMNYRILCEREDADQNITKVMVVVYQDLDGNCEITDEVNVISPLDESGVLDEQDFTMRASFAADGFNWEDNTLTFMVEGVAHYDMVAMAQMEPGSVVEIDGNYIVVDTVEEGETTRVNSEGTEEKAATRTVNKDDCVLVFTADEGGVWVAHIEDDHNAVVEIGEKTLPVSEALAFTDCTDNPGESVEVSLEDLPGYMQEKMEAGSGNYGPYNTTVEVRNSEVVSIVRTWMP